jgi:hypothetical protein
MMIPATFLPMIGQGNAFHVCYQSTILLAPAFAAAGVKTDRNGEEVHSILLVLSSALCKISELILRHAISLRPIAHSLPTLPQPITALNAQRA